MDYPSFFLFYKIFDRFTSLGLEQLFEQNNLRTLEGKSVLTTQISELFICKGSQAKKEF